jgi:hypothetical protein
VAPKTTPWGLATAKVENGKKNLLTNQKRCAIMIVQKGKGIPSNPIPHQKSSKTSKKSS